MADLGGIERELISYWRQQPQLRLRSGATDAQISQFESRYEIVLPTELRDVYERVNGFDQHSHCMDVNGFNFYPLGDFKRLDELEDSFDISDLDHFFLFCDYLTWSWGYAVRMGEVDTPTEVVLLGVEGPGVRLLATTISRFWELYMQDDLKLYI